MNNQSLTSAPGRICIRVCLTPRFVDSIARRFRVTGSLIDAVDDKRVFEPERPRKVTPPTRIVSVYVLKKNETAAAAVQQDGAGAVIGPDGFPVALQAAEKRGSP